MKSLEVVCLLYLAVSSHAFVPSVSMTRPRWMETAARLVPSQRGASPSSAGRVVSLAGAATEEGAASPRDEEEEEIGPKVAPKGFAKKMAEGTKTSTEEELATRLSERQKMAYWEAQKEMERELDMKEIEEYKETQRLIEEGVVGYLPEKISNRMLKRLIPFISLPVLTGLSLFGIFIYINKNTDIEVSPPVVAVVTQFPFLLALLGITYSIMSTSWDPDVEGSFLGTEQFKLNVMNLLESLQKTKREERAKEKIRRYEQEAAPNRAKRRALNKMTK